MCTRRLSLFLETAKTYLCDRNPAHGDARRFFASGDEIAATSLPAVSDRASPARIARARTLGADGL